MSFKSPKGQWVNSYNRLLRNHSLLILEGNCWENMDWCHLIEIVCWTIQKNKNKNFSSSAITFISNSDIHHFTGTVMCSFCQQTIYHLVLFIETTTSRTWWHHQMETFSALLDLCAGNSPVTGEFPSQRPVMRSFDVFSDLHLNKQLNNQSWGWWFETPSCSLWHHCNEFSDY